MRIAVKAKKYNKSQMNADKRRFVASDLCMIKTVISNLFSTVEIFLIPSNLAQHSGHFHKTFLLPAL